MAYRCRTSTSKNSNSRTFCVPRTAHDDSAFLDALAALEKKLNLVANTVEAYTQVKGLMGPPKIGDHAARNDAMRDDAMRDDAMRNESCS
jgi:hypothetical protein